MATKEKEHAASHAHRATKKDQPDNQVSITDEGFLPDQLSVKVGQAVHWVNEDATTHTVTFDPPPGVVNKEFDARTLGVGGGSTIPPPAPIPAEGGSTALAAGATFDKTFSTPGTYTYHCDLHPDMKGTITVS